MKTLLFFAICVLMSLKLSAQVNPNFSCDDFSFEVSSNTRASVEFVSKEKYLDTIKDSVPKSKKPVIQENKILNTEFQKSFPNTITEHCVHSKNFEDGQIGETSFCNKKYKMFLVSKEYHFYIFKIQAFEIDGYLVFNSDDKTIYNTDNYPIILDNGKMILDIGYLKVLISLSIISLMIKKLIILNCPFHFIIR